MNLFSKVRQAIQEKRMEHKERKQIDKEAKQTAKREYLPLYREEKLKAERERMRFRAQQEAQARTPLRRSENTISPTVRGILDGLSTSGRNFLENDSMAIPKANIDFGFGSPSNRKVAIPDFSKEIGRPRKHGKKKKKQEIFDPWKFK